MSNKATAFVMAVMAGLFTVVAAVFSVATGSWMPLACVAIAFGITGLIFAIEVPLLIWADKRWKK